MNSTTGPRMCLITFGENNLWNLAEISCLLDTLYAAAAIAWGRNPER